MCWKEVNTGTIEELNTKAPDGSALGNLYTENLNYAPVPVVRVKDLAMNNDASIKTLLGSIAATTASSGQ